MLLGVLVLIVAGIGSCSFIIFRAATAPIGAANDWLALVDEGRFDEAYAELCPALQGSGEEVVLADLAARFGNGLDSYDLTSYNNQNGFVTVAGQVAVTGAPSSIVTFSMEKVDGEWRVCGY